MATVDDIRAELRALHKGPGVRAAPLHRKLGPRLRELLDVVADTSEHEVRARLTAVLRESLVGLPPDQQTAFGIASALDDEAGTLQDRLARAEQELDRDQRTVMRRVRAADAAIASKLAGRLEARHRSNPLVPGGWQVTRMAATLDLEGDRPVFTGRRRLVSTGDFVDTIVEAVSIRRPLTGDQQVTAACTEGGEVTSMVQVSPSSWQITTTLTDRLYHDAWRDYTLQVTMPSYQVMGPFNILVPFRYCYSFLAEVRFGDAPTSGVGTRLDGVPPYLIDDGDYGPDTFEIPPGHIERVSYQTLLAGAAYGLRWAWA